MMDIVEFLLARLSEDEQWALAASTPYRHAIGNPEVPPGGVHWTWVVGDGWEPVTPNPIEGEVVSLDDHGVSRWDCNLATVEKWQAERGTMRKTYAHSIEEMDASAAGHITRHDPARVLAEVATKRLIVSEFLEAVQAVADLYELGDSARRRVELASATARRNAFADVIRLHAASHADHPDYREGWRP